MSAHAREDGGGSGAAALPAGMRVFERGWLSSNNILFTAGGETALIDSGYVSHAPQTLALVDAGLRAAGKTGLDLLVNTHLHSDHCGGNAALQARHACRTLIPANELAKVRAWDEDALSYRATGQDCPRFAADGGYAPGDTLELGGMRWQALAAPGHDPHALMLYNADERILISGDALWRDGFGVIFPELEGESGFDEVLATLDLIAGLPVRLVIPGHGSPFVGVEDALERAYARHAYLAGDPLRNAWHALKVLVKFRLLDRREMSWTELESWAGGAQLLGTMRRRYFKEPLPLLLERVVQGLEKAGAARCRDGMLMDAG